MANYKLLSKTIFFPKQGILAVGDLHLGYDSMLKNQGIRLNFDQLEETKKELEIIIRKIKALSTLKKIILLGDIKHHFSFQREELFDLRNFLRFLEKFLPKEDIILIKGNHDTFTLKEYKIHEVYLSEDQTLAFTHGDKTYPELFDKKNKSIKSVIISHIHPAVLLKDKNNIKKEKYKCFLIGKYKSKEFIVVPSFFPIIEGSEVNELESSKGKFQTIIPSTKLKSFEAYIIGKNKVYPFGKLKDIN